LPAWPQRSAGLLQRAREADAIAQLLEVRAQHEPDVRLIINHQEVPCRDGQRRTGLKQTSDGCAVSTQVEQEGAHVRRGLHQHDEEGVSMEYGDHGEAAAELEHALVKSPRPPASPSCAMCLIAVGSRQRHCRHPRRWPRVNRWAGRPAHDYHGVHAGRTAEGLNNVADGRHTRAT